MTAPNPGPAPRPPDVDTGFWLWLAALPLLVTSYVVGVVGAPVGETPWFTRAFAAYLVVVVAAIVATFLILMRHGYRWARTLLTGGGAATVVYAVSGLFTVDRPPVAALVYAASAIVGSVLVAGGIYLLHRKDAHTYFTR